VARQVFYRFSNVANRTERAADVAQDVLGDMDAVVLAYRGEGSFEGFLRTTIWRRSVTSLRATRREVELPSDWSSSPDESVLVTLVQDEDTRRVMQALLALSASSEKGRRQARTAKLRSAGHGWQEIAGMEGVSVTTCERAFVAALRFVEEYFERQGWAPNFVRSYHGE